MAAPSDEEAFLREAAFRAPIGRDLHRPDTRVITRPGWYQVVTPSAVGYLDEVYVSQVAEEEAERAIDEVIAEHAPRKAPVKWCVGHWTEPRGFRERLLARGFTETPVRAMACRTDLEVAPPSVEVAIEEVTLASVDAYVAFETRGWGIPADQIPVERQTHRAALTAAPRTAHFFAAKVDGAYVGTAGIFLRGDVGYLVGSFVAPEARGRGLYRALVAARLAFLRERGFAHAVTHARDATSAPRLEHLGFTTVYRYGCFYLTP